jgi:hypothetical protein
MVDYGENDSVIFDKFYGVMEGDFIFFPVTDLNYDNRLNELNVSQCLHRLKILFNIWTRHN